jgi:hypothetical protein
MVAGKRKRPYICGVPLYPQEKEELQQAASQAGLALAVFVRMLALVAC